ncbi:methionine aminopeptidase 1D, mitochondrial-like [Ptychodera flava]|uniref:methionine aminopeptidase 1D, mitochondrial-like n=1 Tax=Ptychodera flava TaxID=63121 RepID=UPI003969C01B
MAAPMVSRVLRLTRNCQNQGLVLRSRQFSSCGCVLSKHHNITLQSRILTRTMSWFTMFQWLWKKPPQDLPYSIVEPSVVSPMRTVPNGIEKPSYADTGNVPPKLKKADIKDEKAIEKMRKSCVLARKILDLAGRHVKVGITTEELDIIVHNACIEEGCYPSTLNYNGFPKSVCTSVNNVMVHGVPDDRPLEDGDIITIDVTVFYQGYHGDVAETFLVGDVDDAGKHLVAVAKRCRDEAIKVCKPGLPLAAIGYKVDQIAQEAGLCASPSFMGHGIGQYFHGPPDVLHTVNSIPDKMETGMVFTIEPVITDGKTYPIALEDMWTIVSANNERSAQFEHTVLITEDGFEVLTIGKDDDYNAND